MMFGRRLQSCIRIAKPFLLGLVLCAIAPGGGTPASAEQAQKPPPKRRAAKSDPVGVPLWQVFGADDGAPSGDVGPGRWWKARPLGESSALTAEQSAEIARLEAIGYLAGSVEGLASGVTRYAEDRTASGLNFFTSGHAPEATLMDMRGKVLHRWRFEFSQAWPDSPVSPRNQNTQFWRRAYLFENGDVLAIFAGLGLIRVDKDSKLIWASPVSAHHDLDIAPNGDIYVLTREAHMNPHASEHFPILEDFVSILAPDGREKQRISLLAAIENSAYKDLWLTSKQRVGDIFHTNALKLLDGRAVQSLPAFKEGNVLVSMAVLNTIAVVDLEKIRVVWAHRGGFKLQHDPKLLANGRMLLFDNMGEPDHSKVIEFNPITGQTHWEYRGTPKAPFFTRSCGTANRLPNGNTLISESDNGRAFEITPDGEIVWEFYNPNRAGENDEYIATLFDLVRVPSTFSLDWMDSGPPR